MDAINLVRTSTRMSLANPQPHHLHMHSRAHLSVHGCAALKTLDGRAEISDSGATQANYPALIGDAKSPEITSPSRRQTAINS